MPPPPLATSESSRHAGPETQKTAAQSRSRGRRLRRDVLLRALGLAIALHLAFMAKLGLLWTLDDELSASWGPLANSVPSEASRPSSSSSSWSFDPAAARLVQSHFLRTTGRRSPTLAAYAEPPLPAEPWSEPKAGAEPGAKATAEGASSPRRRPRLPLRTHGPHDLTVHEYPAVSSCSALPASLPVSHPPSSDVKFGTTTFNAQPLYPLRREYARYCPVDHDPFLPWIHDVFPSRDGRYVEFVAQNKRRCNTDPKTFVEDLANLEPQVGIMQPVPVRRLRGGDDEAQAMAAELWRPRGGDEEPKRDDEEEEERKYHRYRLASHDDADPDGTETRFVCRFHAWTVNSRGGDGSPAAAAPPRPVILGETLSVYPYNYELANLRKPRSHPMLTRPPNAKAKGGSGQPPHNTQIWNSALHFRCPVPEGLVELVKSGRSVVDDIASVYVDVVPIRTYPRTNVVGYIRGVNGSDGDGFNSDMEWGRAHVLPRVEASGRWANVPVCLPPGLDTAGAGAPLLDPKATVVELGGRRQQRQPQQQRTADSSSNSTEGHNTHRRQRFLIGCTWASSTFSTRGSGDADTSTPERLMEWLTYHLDVAGFDHMYVYDNTAAHTNATSLAPVTDLFPGRVTRINWPHRVCNNNRPAHPSTGERSSQYAAEASCRLRYGSGADWMISFDADEYLVPVGRWTSIAEWLREGVGGKGRSRANILSFFMTRARPNIHFMEPYRDDDRGGPSKCKKDKSCLAKRLNATFIEAYDCETTPPPKPDWGWRAKKQIYRPWYVLNHFVHYSVVTRRLLDSPSESSPPFKEIRPYERRVDELTEAFMLHAKTTKPDWTAGWRETCRKADNCPVGIPWPMAKEGDKAEVAPPESFGAGLPYNCYRHEQVTSLVLPKLREALSRRLKQRQ